MGANGRIERYKARLVAKGFTQTCGVDYLDIIAPVAKMKTTTIIQSLAVSFKKGCENNKKLRIRLIPL